MTAIQSGLSAAAAADGTHWLSVCSASCPGFPVTAGDHLTLSMRLTVPVVFTVLQHCFWVLLVNARTHTQPFYGPLGFCLELHCVSKNVLTLKRYSSKLQGAILMKFGRNVQNTLE